ncbi:hypothetical protein F4818DRAFT_416669 [Hypoxylon cercidicola]|nr:hypothetical protein F4818DRAFT_416669 [Hypoxylon cercidicola]
MSEMEKKFYTDRGLEIPRPEAIPPLRANSIRNFDADVIRRDAAHTRILIHNGFLGLVDKFLAYKRQHGTTKEKQLYANMTVGKEIARLYRNRPLAFYNSSDTTKLRNGKMIPYATRLWDAVGTDSEGDITLNEYLSYDEIMLSSFIGVSGPSTFINDGDRDNCAQPGVPGTFETRGIIIGLVGARFERIEHMDSNLILNRNDQSLQNKPSRQDPELTKIFLDFLEVRKQGGQFEVDVYIARMKYPLSLLLLEAQSRAHLESPSKKAYVYVVGLGLGVWQINSKQADYYVQAFCEVLREQGKDLSQIATIELAWIQVDKGIRDQATAIAAEYGIKVKFSRRNPAAKLDRDEQDQLLVLSYAWDANAYPGNEYWMGSLNGSGDPAAAAMSTIAEIQNPESNPSIWRFFESFQYP